MADPRLTPDDLLQRWVKVLDQDKCIGCHACTTENEVPLGVTRTYVKSVEAGIFPQVRRPEKDPRPGLFYKGAHQATLGPLAARRPDEGLFAWATQGGEHDADHVTAGHPGRPSSSAEALLSYDIPHHAPWGWRVSLCTWAKGIGAGGLAVQAVLASAAAILPFALRAGPGEAGPEERVRDLTGALTTPVRSGIILTRRRIGGRQYTRRAMLEQDPTLAWLGQEARRWEARHASRVPGDAAGRWRAARAARTGLLLKSAATARPCPPAPAGAPARAPGPGGTRELALAGDV